MAGCTAPVRGHRSSAAAADCPACGSRYSRFGGYGGYGGDYGSRGSYSSPSYSSSGSGGRSSGGSGRRTAKPRWSGAGSAVLYTPEQVQALTPVRENVENLEQIRLNPGHIRQSRNSADIPLA